MAELLCGLLCRFMGSRFVAAGEHAVICSTAGTHANDAIQYTITLHQGHVTLDIKQMALSGTAAAATSSRAKYKVPISGSGDGSFHRAVVLTALVARWVSPKICGLSLMQTPYAGVKGCSKALAITIAAAVMTFVSEPILTYNKRSKTAIGSKTSVQFWERYIVIHSAATNNKATIPCSEGITSLPTKNGFMYIDNSYRQTNALDAFIVRSCQAAMLLKSSR